MAEKQVHPYDDSSLGSASGAAGFHGLSSAKAAAITSPAATAATDSTPFGYSEAQANAIVTALNALLVACRDKGIISS